MLKTLDKIDHFLQQQIDGTYILINFAWYFVFIPFRFFYEPIDHIWGGGKRRRNDIKESRLYNQANIEILKRITETKEKITKEDLRQYMTTEGYETKYFDENIQYLINWDYIKFSDDMNSYYSTTKHYSSLEEKFGYDSKTKKWENRHK